MVKPATCFVRGLDSVDMAALYLLVLEDSKLDEEVSEITEAGLLGVKGILDGVALVLDEGVAGIRGMTLRVKLQRRFRGRSSVVVGSSLRLRAVTRKYLLKVVELWEVEPNVQLL